MVKLAHARIVQGEIVLTTEITNREPLSPKEQRERAKVKRKVRQAWRCPTCGVKIVGTLDYCLACKVTRDGEPWPGH